MRRHQFELVSIAILAQLPNSPFGLAARGISTKKGISSLLRRMRVLGLVRKSEITTPRVEGHGRPRTIWDRTSSGLAVLTEARKFIAQQIGGAG